jgi:hemin uptake protein HemP
MAAPSGDDVGDAAKHAENPSPAARSLVMSGNRIDSRELFLVEREIIIAHGEDNYRLRLTSQNKLILTK